MKASINALAEVFYSEGSVSRNQLNRLFDEAEVPPSVCWRGILGLMLGCNVEFPPGLDRGRTRPKLEKGMNQALKIISAGQYSELELLELVNCYNSAFVSVCHAELSDALIELEGFTKEFKSVCKDRQGNIAVLQKQTLETVESDLEIREKIKVIKTRFRQTIELFKADVVKLDRMNHTDHLTRLYNRRFFDKQLAVEVKQALKEKTWLHLLMIDIDDFKHFNDTYGHLIGDQALKTVAKHIRKVCDAASEVSGIDFFPTRYGGEEFAVILPAVETVQAGTIAEGIRKKIFDYTFVIRRTDGTIKHKGLKLTVSIGVAALAHGVDENAMAGEVLIKKADENLFNAKNSGKNRVCVPD